MTAILTNKRVIAINQDPLGRQGMRLTESPPGLGIWVKELTGSRLAIAFLRVQQKHIHEEANLDVAINFSDIKSYFPDRQWSQKFRLEEVFEDELIGTFSFRDTFGLERGNNDAATVMLVTLSLLDSERDLGVTEYHDYDDNPRWRDMHDMGKQRENRILRMELMLSCLSIFFLVLLGLRLRQCLCRRMPRFRPYNS